MNSLALLTRSGAAVGSETSAMAIGSSTVEGLLQPGPGLGGGEGVDGRPALGRVEDKVLDRMLV